MTKLSRFKNARKSATELNDELFKNKNSRDERIWQFALDPKTNTSENVIRFLPSQDELMMVSRSEHFFQGEKGWFVEKCPKSLGREHDCPVCDEYWAEWHRVGKNRDLMDKPIKKMNPTKKFMCNILVISDSTNPENNGKVFLFEFKNYIHNDIKEALNPTFKGSVPFNPFDLWEGADYNFRIHKDGEYASFTKSSWERPSQLFDGDESKLEKLVGELHNISEFTFEEEILRKQESGEYISNYERVMGKTTPAQQDANDGFDDDFADFEGSSDSEEENVRTPNNHDDDLLDDLSEFDELLND